jgi:signal transduction histidine kinase
LILIDILATFVAFLRGGHRLSIRGRITIALGATTLLLFAVYATYQESVERADLNRSITREVRFLGRSLQVSVENALRDRQIGDITETLEKLESVEPLIDIMVFDADRHLNARSAGSPDPDALLLAAVDKATRTRAPAMEFLPPEPSQRLVFALPLQDDAGGSIGTLALVRPLDDMLADLSATRRNMVLEGIALALVTTLVGLALGTAYLSRPLAAIVSAMRSVRSGDLRSTVGVHRIDEVSQVATEFNAMVAELFEARQRILAEQEARGKLERGLREVDKMVTIGQLSAGLAHEIGSPLQILNGRARALLARDHDRDEIRRNAEILAAQTDRIAHIVEQLLQFGRRRPPAVTDFDLVQATRAILELVEPDARRRRIDLRLACAEGSLPLEADRDQVQQIVLNLLTNALASTPAGGTVSLTLGPSHLVLGSTRARVPAVRLIVSDNGHGIPPEVQERLFEPFFTTRAGEGGTGLGLSVVRALVAEHDGSVTVASAPGQGASFTVDLPCRHSAGRSEVKTG